MGMGLSSVPARAAMTTYSSALQSYSNNIEGWIQGLPASAKRSLESEIQTLKMAIRNKNSIEIAYLNLLKSVYSHPKFEDPESPLLKHTQNHVAALQSENHAGAAHAYCRMSPDLAETCDPWAESIQKKKKPQTIQSNYRELLKAYHSEQRVVEKMLEAEAQARARATKKIIRGLPSSADIQSPLSGRIDSEDCQNKKESKQKLWVSKKNYDAVLQLNDLSSMLAKKHTSKASSLPRVDRHADKLIDSLSDQGWTQFEVPFGRTGRYLQDQDAACVMGYNADENLIVVAFHGSRFGSKLPWGVDGDWGSNFNNEAISAADLKLGLDRRTGKQVKMHKGYGSEFQVIQKSLYEKLDRQIAWALNKKKGIPQIIITGHSKGGAIASLATPFIRDYFHRRRRIPAQVGAITLSAPRAFIDDSSKEWALKALGGKKNHLRIYVPWDPVTWWPGKWRGYRDVGLDIPDERARVRQRLRQRYNIEPTWLSQSGLTTGLGFNAISSIHYGTHYQRVGGRFSFDVNAVMPYEELVETFESMDTEDGN